ncbi:MAG: winged helix-turn-helix domain-containing protein [Aigarchaeota archaeon]|nr:winged helix-turn-helix domain-containing protein [Aigarchaeota archaeon]MDW8092352.1 winged helix-turn-helix domain-containing protein [Nitrososphaerota archaeon]
MQIDQLDLTQLARIFGALGSPIRLQILQTVLKSDKPLHIKALSRSLKVKYTAIYRHVQVLKGAGLVTIYEVGRSRVVSVKGKETINDLIKIALNIQK